MMFVFGFITASLVALFGVWIGWKTWPWVSSKNPPIRWQYQGEELCIFWTNPYNGNPEKIASFWWPVHPPEDTARIEGTFEEMANTFMEEWNRR